MNLASGKELSKEILLSSFSSKERDKVVSVTEDLPELDETKALNLEIITFKNSKNIDK